MKISAPRRKGDIYQDYVVCKFAFDALIDGRDCEIFIEYERRVAGSFDDIIVFDDKGIEAYQVKHAVHPHDVYEVDDFTNSKSPVYLKKFADSFVKLRSEYPDLDIHLILFSNRAAGTDLGSVLTDAGRFEAAFIEGRQRKRKAEIRSELKVSSGLDEDDFKEFLEVFQFQLKQPNEQALRSYLADTFLKNRLGISDPQVFSVFREKIEYWAVNRQEPLTLSVIRDLLNLSYNEYVLPQRFIVDEAHLVINQDLRNILDEKLEQVDGDYIVVTGKPGSGKSTFLTDYVNYRRTTYGNPVVRYYCFVDVDDNEQLLRVEAEALRVNLLEQLHASFPTLLRDVPRYDYSDKGFNKTLEVLGTHFSKQNDKLLILVDGLDHAERLANQVHCTAIASLPRSVQRGIVIIVGSQELHHWPAHLNRAREAEITHLVLPLFSRGQVDTYLRERHSLTELSDTHITRLTRLSEGLPLYLRYIAEALKNVPSDDIDTFIETLLGIPEGKIDDYYQYLWDEFHDRGAQRHLCAIAALLRFPATRDEWYDISEIPKRYQFNDDFAYIRHLLAEEEDGYKIFHNSFREFILRQLDDASKQEIYSSIFDKLQPQKPNDRWFSYALQYALDAGSLGYLLDEVNRDYVDLALRHYRPDAEIRNAIRLAIEAAYRSEDLVAFGRLALLQERTDLRLKHNLDRTELSEVLLRLNRMEDVLRYTRRNQRWYLNFGDIADLLQTLARQEKYDIGERLFKQFQQDYADTEISNKGNVIYLAGVLAIYASSVPRVLRWLSYFKFSQGIVDWMQYVTTYHDTKWFPRMIFKEVLRQDIKAAFRVLHDYQKTKGLWQVQDCLEMAYAETPAWSSWDQNQYDDFKRILTYDRSFARRFLLNDVYRRLQAEWASKLPTILANGLSQLNEHHQLCELLDIFVEHCHAMFSHLPEMVEDYTWLENYNPVDDQFDELAINFLLFRLDDKEIDVAKRVTEALRQLCLQRPNKAIPAIAQTLNPENPDMCLRRLSVLEGVSIQALEKLELVLHYLADLLDTNNFHIVMAVRNILKRVKENIVLSEDVVRKADWVYSTQIFYSTFRVIHANPSVEFKQALDFCPPSFLERLETTCEVLDLDANSVFARVERTLRSSNWDLERAKAECCDLLGARSHPQGNPIVPFIGPVEITVKHAFYQVLHEILQKQRYSPEQIQQAFQFLQEYDPEYNEERILTRPENVAPLIIEDEYAWLKEFERQPRSVKRFELEQINTDWISLFEWHYISVSETYKVPYRVKKTVISSLIPKEMIGEVVTLGYKDDAILKLAHYELQRVTLEQAKQYIATHPNHPIRNPNGSIPILSLHINDTFFHGFREVVTLTWPIIKHYDLKWDGFNLAHSGHTVVRFEPWQEGYEDEAYSRQILSRGTQLRIQKAFLSELLSDYHVVLYRKINEIRMVLPEKYSKESSPTSEARAERIEVIC